MLTRFGNALLAVAVASTVALGAARQPAPYAGGGLVAFQPESRLWVEGTSTVRNYRCQAGALEGGITLAKSAGAIGLRDLATAVDAAELAVPVALLACGNGTMDGHMRKALKAAEHPSIRYRHESHRLTGDPTGAGEVELSGRLSIAGQEQPITMQAEIVEEEDGALRVRGSKELRMTEWGIKPPSLMLGTLKVRDPVVVHFDVLLKP